MDARDESIPVELEFVNPAGFVERRALAPWCKSIGWGNFTALTDDGWRFPRHESP